MMTCDEIREYRNQYNMFARYLGIETTVLEIGYARGELELKDDYKNISGSTHGGCIFTLMDTIGAAAASARGVRMTTISGDVNYLNPTLDISKLVCEARELKYGKKISVYSVQVYDDKENILTTGTFSYFNLHSSYSDS